MTAEAFETDVSQVLEKVRTGEMSQEQRRALAANTVEVTIDAQGRVNIDEKLRAYAGISLGAKVVVAGSFDRVEIWEPERHERTISAGTEKIAGAGA
jgi:DNA-binding transcriptional regulator/RsmH inhibitor MraZ